MLSRTSLFALLGIGLLACGDDKPVVTPPVTDAGADGSSALAIAPVNTVAIIDLSAKAGTAVTYKVTDGTSDVSSTAALTLDDPTLGNFAGPVFTSALGLPKGASVANTNVHATVAGRNVSTGLWLGALRKSGTHRDLLFTAAAGSFAPQSDLLQMQLTVNGVDVMLLAQTSGSTPLANLKVALPNFISLLLNAIPSPNLGVADFSDYPLLPFGFSPDDLPVNVGQLLSPTPQDSQTATQALKYRLGADTPCSALPAMHHLLTGEALSWPSSSVPAHAPAVGHFGGADFRSDAEAFVVALTNTAWHDTANTPYSFPAPTMADVKKDFTSTGVRFIGVTDTQNGVSEAQADELSDATNSNISPSAFGGQCGVGQCCTGASGAGRAPTGPGGTCRMNLLSSGGAGFQSGLIKTLQAATYGAKYDVKVSLRNEPTNPGFVDATLFLKAPEALAAGDVTTGCVANPAKDTDADGVVDTFTSVGVGTPVCFQFAPKAAIAPAATDKPQLFVAYADIVGMPGNVKLATRVVLFVVPAKN